MTEIQDSFEETPSLRELRRKWKIIQEKEREKKKLKALLEKRRKERVMMRKEKGRIWGGEI